MLLSQCLRQLANRWSPRGAKRRRRAGRVSAPTLRRVRPTLELLENRLSPAVYNYDVVAQTGYGVNQPNGTPAQGTLTNLAQASINDSGNVAFLGTLTTVSNNSYSGVDEATISGGVTTLSVLSNNLSSTIRYFSFPQINNDNNVIAQDQTLIGSTLSSYIRV